MTPATLSTNGAHPKNGQLPGPAPARPKRPLTREQLQARQANARHSTGPRTEAGKSRARFNALKHGQRSRAPHLPEHATAVARRAAELAADLRPRGAVERQLVRDAAWAAVRLDRLRREDDLAYQARRRGAVARWDATRAAEVAALAARLMQPIPPPLRVGPAEFNIPPLPPPPIDRDTPRRALEATAEGCAWLADAWEALADALLADTWTAEHGARVLRLLGHDLDRGAPADHDAVAAWHALHALGLDHPAAPPPARDLPDPDAARACLLTLATAQAQHLQARMERLWAECDGPDRAEAPERVAVEASREGQLRQRYLASAARDLYRALTLIENSRRSGRLGTRVDLPEMGDSAAEPEAAVEGVSDPGPDDVATPAAVPDQANPALARAPAPNEPKRPETLNHEELATERTEASEAPAGARRPRLLTRRERRRAKALARRR